MNLTGALLANKFRESMIFLILIFISGQVDCAKVSAYTGGSVLIMCKYDHTEKINHTKYFCKLSGQDCTEKIYSNTTDHERIVFFVDGNWPGMFPVLIKNIHQQDEGTYRCGVEERKPQAQFTVDLNVKEDPCCGKTLKQKTHPGETVNFTCVYPEEFKYHTKFMYKVTNRSFRAVIVTHGGLVQNESFSIHDHPEEKLFNINISKVTEEDGGVYLCGVQKFGDFNLVSFLDEIQLQVNAKGPGSTSGPTTSGYVIITVCVCVGLLLVGGSALIIYKLRNPLTPGSSSSNQRTTDVDYENDRPRNLNNVNVQDSPSYENQNCNTNQSDSVYQSLNPNTNQSDSVYNTLSSNANQSDSAYQSLNPNTNQSDSVYHTLNSNANQSD